RPGPPASGPAPPSSHPRSPASASATPPWRCSWGPPPGWPPWVSWPWVSGCSGESASWNGSHCSAGRDSEDRPRSRLASPAPAQDLDAVEQAFEAEEEVRVVDGVGRRRGRALEQEIGRA